MAGQGRAGRRAWLTRALDGGIWVIPIIKQTSRAPDAGPSQSAFYIIKKHAWDGRCVRQMARVCGTGSTSSLVLGSMMKRVARSACEIQVAATLR